VQLDFVMKDQLGSKMSLAKGEIELPTRG